MKRRHLALLSFPLAFVVVVAAAACSDSDKDAPLKPGAGRYYQPKDGGGGGEGGVTDANASAPDADAAPVEMPREIKTVPQALKVMMTAYDAEIAEGEVGKSGGTTPAVKAYSGDLVEDMRTARGRLRGLAEAKGLTPAKSNLSDRMRFESQAAVSHLKYVLKDMFNDAYINRRIATAEGLLRLLDEELGAVVGDDAELKAELDTTRKETEKRLTRAEAVRSGLMSGPASSDGMFEEPDDPVPAPRDAGGPMGPIALPDGGR